MMIIGAYIGDVSNNSGELNPGKWDWDDKWTYISMGIGGAAGALGGYGIMNPGSVGLTLGASSPYVAAGITTTLGGTALGQGTDWKFDLQWTTAAGGGGSTRLNGNNPLSAEQVVNQKIAQVRQMHGAAWRARSGGGASADYLLPKLYWHNQFGGGVDYNLNASTLDFSGTSQKELDLIGMKVGDSKGVNPPLPRDCIAWLRNKIK